MNIYLRTKENYFQAVKLEDIKYLEASSNYTKVVTVSTEFILAKTLRIVEEVIKEKDYNNIFLRFNRSALINKNYVTQICGCTVYIGNKTFSVRQRMRQAVMKHFVFI